MEFCDVDTEYDEGLSATGSIRTVGSKIDKSRGCGGINARRDGVVGDERDGVHPLRRSTSEADIQKIM